MNVNWLNSVAPFGHSRTHHFTFNQISLIDLVKLIRVVHSLPSVVAPSFPFVHTSLSHSSGTSLRLSLFRLTAPLSPVASFHWFHLTSFKFNSVNSTNCIPLSLCFACIPLLKLSLHSFHFIAVITFSFHNVHIAVTAHYFHCLYSFTPLINTNSISSLKVPSFH